MRKKIIRGRKRGKAPRVRKNPGHMPEEKFWDENEKINADDAVVINPTSRDIIDEVSGLDSFRDYARESRGNTLSYGDY